MKVTIRKRTVSPDKVLGVRHKHFTDTFRANCPGEPYANYHLRIRLGADRRRLALMVIAADVLMRAIGSSSAVLSGANTTHHRAAKRDTTMAVLSLSWPGIDVGRPRTGRSSPGDEAPCFGRKPSE
jgi:hypothetical protein